MLLAFHCGGEKRSVQVFQNLIPHVGLKYSIHVLYKALDNQIFMFFRLCYYFHPLECKI